LPASIIDYQSVLFLAHYNPPAGHCQTFSTCSRFIEKLAKPARKTPPTHLLTGGGIPDSRRAVALGRHRPLPSPACRYSGLPLPPGLTPAPFFPKKKTEENKRLTKHLSKYIQNHLILAVFTVCHSDQI